ncbi:Mur ligase C-terminal [Penicillium verhagenii]|uniref:Mur ligase C-terminal n=1 Tax=Penicillium verhagenii TaxID=1562060 RepID=UPI002545AC10|nr:Mur ligase C-terminal [Penicillium verhagenii]KAJ5938434.1 Mur ligase C-terminal [Penicillium verhagenii]
MHHSYENALELLDARRRKARPKAPIETTESQAAATPSGKKTTRGVPSLVGMDEWLRALGHSELDVDRLNIIHIAGTKGKGSTCAFTSCLLRSHGLRTGFPKSVGLYTSPDLQCIRERIQIDNQPITEALFTQYFFEIWEALLYAEVERQPRYLQLLALLAFHTFIREGVDAAVFETHHGGEYDATNVIRRPIATGITSLGMDHVEQLGPTLEDIAWHKAGIFKAGTPAFSVTQERNVVEILRSRAAEKKTDLMFVSMNSSLPVNDRVLGVPVQRLNCSLALELARSFVHSKTPDHILESKDISSGVESFSWIGRFEVILDGTIRWFLDGAHNTLSLTQAAEWFSSYSSATQKYERDGVALVECLARSLSKHNARPDYVIFTTYQEREDGSTRIDKTLKVPEIPFPDFCTIYSSLWVELEPKAAVSTEPNIEGAIRFAKQLGAQRDGMEVLVTGSLHLVGGALTFLRP